MKQVAIGFWFCKIVATIAMLIGAALWVHTILVTGPILATLGLLLAVATRPLQSWLALAFSLSGPLVCALISLLIAVNKWTPDESVTPVIAILSGYLLLMLPAAFFTLRLIQNWDSVIHGPTPSPFRFSLKSLLVLTTLFCFLIAAITYLLQLIGRNPSFIGENLVFGGFTVVVVALCGVVAFRFITFCRASYSPG